MTLHQLLRLTRPLIVVDVETTGIDPKEARIVELGFQVWTAEGMTKEWRSLINPGVPIPQETTKVHGIGDGTFKKCAKCGRIIEEHARETHFSEHLTPNPSDVTKSVMGQSTMLGDPLCERFRPWPTFAQLAPNLARGFSGCDFAGKNVRYDLRVLAVEFGRAGVAWSYMNSRIVDAERLEQLGEPRHLSNLYEKHVGHLCTECGKTRGDGNHDSGMIDYSHAFKGKKLEDAHQALADVRATTEVIVAQLRKYATLPRDLDALHAAQWPHLADAIDVDGKFKFVSGVPYVGNWGKWANCPMSRVDVGYWKFILGADFSADVKKLASDALMGVFPEVKR